MATSRRNEFSAAAAAKSDAMRDIQQEFGPAGKDHSSGEGRFGKSKESVKYPEHNTEETYIKWCPDCRTDASRGQHPKKFKGAN